MKNFIFDFDGVICDSTDECFVTSYNAWLEYNSKNSFYTKLNELDSDIYKAFVRFRPYVRGGGEYYIVYRLILNQDFIITNEKFNKLRVKWKNEIKEFSNIFYKNRSNLIDYSINDWINLNKIFKDVLSIITTLHTLDRLFIATLKDKESIKIILKNYKIDLSDEKIIDQSQVSNKLDALNYFVDNKFFLKENIIFLDDNINHLIEPKKSGYNVILTYWCNQIKDFKEIAKLNKIPIVENINKIDFFINV